MVQLLCKDSLEVRYKAKRTLTILPNCQKSHFRYLSKRNESTSTQRLVDEHSWQRTHNSLKLETIRMFTNRRTDRLRCIRATNTTQR